MDSAASASAFKPSFNLGLVSPLGPNSALILAVNQAVSVPVPTGFLPVVSKALQQRGVVIKEQKRGKFLKVPGNSAFMLLVNQDPDTDLFVVKTLTLRTLGATLVTANQGTTTTGMKAQLKLSEANLEQLPELGRLLALIDSQEVTNRLNADLNAWAAIFGHINWGNLVDELEKFGVAKASTIPAPEPDDGNENPSFEQQVAALRGSVPQAAD